MKNNLLKKMLLPAVAVTGAFILHATALAAPYSGYEYKFKQPDGSSLTVKLFGDEYYGRIESLDGYTLIKDAKTGWLCYATLNSDASDLVSTGVPYYRVNSVQPAQFTKPSKGIKLTGANLEKKVEEGRVKFKAASAPENTISQGTQASSKSVSSTAKMPVNGYITGLTILVKFPDDESNGVPILPTSEINNMFNELGYNKYGNNGSIKDYFREVSGGTVTYDNIITPVYYTAKNPRSYYNLPTTPGQTIVYEALEALANQGFDFSKLTKNPSGDVMCLNILYSGNRPDTWAVGLWPHKSSLGNVTYGGTTFNTYQMTDITDTPSIGTIVHETGHMMCKWPDTYVYYDVGSGAGRYDLMSSSSRFNPLWPNPYFTHKLAGWGSSEKLNDYSAKTALTANSNSRDLYIYETHKQNEYFIIENMRKRLRNSESADEGLLVWHIDEYGNNAYPSGTNYMVAVEQADGLNELELGIDSGDSNDLFHAGYKTQFDSSTVPNSNLYDGSASGLKISEIGSIGNCMTFKYEPPLKSITNAPANLDISSRSGNAITLSWLAPSGFATKNYNVYADINNGAGTNRINLGVTANTSMNYTLSNNLIYTFYVVALDAYGNQSNVSKPLVVSTDNVLPSAPTGLRELGSSSTMTDIAWDNSTDNFGVKKYEIYYGTTLIDTVTTTHATIKGLAPNTIYTFTVRACDINNKSVASSPLTVITRLAPPQNLRISSKTSTNVTLNWDALTGASRYYIYAYENNGTSHMRVDFGYTTGTSVVAATNNNCIYEFYVMAVNSTGTQVSDESLGLVYSKDITAPTAPTGLGYSNLTSTSITLSWNASTDTFGVKCYNIYDGTTLVGQSMGKTFKITNYNPNVSHRYTVKAVDTSDNLSAASNAVVL
ncbi:MAG TPA: M6 family metalloprotease domain-containing protein [Pseudobacteroides sp.]|uniref:M6 family metalloprotease domain-containing protein n=1 Tax=Pseudobacteroides sp. TaxID=1968840 RepID=UPI002F9332B6